MARINTGTGWTAADPAAAGDDHIVLHSSLWTWTTKTADAGTAGQVGINTTAWATATRVNINQQDNGNTDATNAYGKMRAGDIIYLQHATDATRFARYDVTGPPTDNGNWWAFPVVPNTVGSTGVPPSGNTNTVVRLIGHI